MSGGFCHRRAKYQHSDAVEVSVSDVQAIHSRCGSTFGRHDAERECGDQQRHERLRRGGGAARRGKQVEHAQRRAPGMRTARRSPSRTAAPVAAESAGASSAKMQTTRANAEAMKVIDQAHVHLAREIHASGDATGNHRAEHDAGDDGQEQRGVRRLAHSPVLLDDRGRGADETRDRAEVDGRGQRQHEEFRDGAAP